MADKLRLTGKAMPTPIYADYELAAIILKTCAPRPEDRFQTPAELKQALVYYMQRNEVSDTLIVPPIVTPEAPLAPEAETAEEEAPARMTDAEQLDEKFRTSFAPDLSGAGTEKDIDPDAVPDAPKPEQKTEEKPQPPAEPEKPAEPVKEASRSKIPSRKRTSRKKKPDRRRKPDPPRQSRRTRIRTRWTWMPSSPR